MKAFITSQFAYCPLVWMLHSRGFNSKINSPHEKDLEITYGDFISLNFRIYKRSITLF